MTGELEIKNAVIVGAEITFSEREILEAWVHLEYGGGTHQNFGGYALYLPKEFTHHNVLSCAGHFIYRTMKIAGVEDWSKLKGKTIRVKGTYGKIHAIGHIINDDWFCPSDDFKELGK